MLPLAQQHEKQRFNLMRDFENNTSKEFKSKNLKFKTLKSIDDPDE